MKVYLPSLLCLALAVWAQNPQPGQPQRPVQPAQPAKPAQPADAQGLAALAALPADAIIATVDGKKVTASEFQSLLRRIPPAQMSRVNRKELLSQYGLMRRLAEMAEKDKLDQNNPWKQDLELSRMQVLSNAMINHQFANMAVQPEEQQKFYESSKDRYTQAKVKVIYIPFSNTPPPQTDPKAKKVLTEAEAKAKAEDLLQQIRAGADFVKLVKEHSGDPTSASKDGDFGTIKKSDNLPEPVKSTVFALKPTQVSEPVRQPNGFYLFRLEELIVQPYEQVKDEILNEVKNTRFRQWMDTTRNSVVVTVENEAALEPK